MSGRAELQFPAMQITQRLEKILSVPVWTAPTQTLIRSLEVTAKDKIK